ncbi:hypothetical protein [Heliothis virescens ascovirus 3j]|uniref:Uncharacterized protein n=1 Tax=Heliothis virescens ascovirus 3j TaxID=1561067 RepID=A0A2Z5UZH7_9VIRU|nr:hypothetical protein [Heliothis virescens ascovirus 3j]
MLKMGVSVRVILQSLLVLFRYDSLLNRILMVLPCEELKPMGPLSLLRQLPKLGEVPVLQDAYFWMPTVTSFAMRECCENSDQRWSGFVYHQSIPSIVL